jgi:hypothetical protein
MITKSIGIIISVGMIYYLFFVRTNLEKEERFEEEIEIYLKIAGLFIVGYLLTYLFGGKRKNQEGKFIPNLVIIRNTGVCINSCYHIHHWMWGAALIISYITLNFLFGYRETEYYKYAISLFLGSGISEYARYGNDIFQIRKRCYPSCSVNKS